eukprot:5664253-Prymnesium_polylepis.1
MGSHASWAHCSQIGDRFYQGEPIYQFGAGLSYTTFESVLEAENGTGGMVRLSSVQQYASAASQAFVLRRISTIDFPIRRVRVSVTNSGQRPGAHSLLCFVSPPRDERHQDDGTPLRSLVDFAKVHLVPGASEQVEFAIFAQHDLTLTPPAGGRIARAGNWIVSVGDATTTVLVD